MVLARKTLVALAGLLVLVACGSSPAGSSTGGNLKSVKVGLLGNLTGDAAKSYGLPFKNGFTMALADADKAGVLSSAKVKLDLSTKDTNSQVPNAVTGFNSFVQQQVPVVISDSQSPIGLAVAPLANDSKVVFLSGAGTKLTNPNGFAFRFTDLTTPTTRLGDYLTKHGAKRVGAIIANDNPSFATLASVTEKGLNGGAGSFAVQLKVASTDSDFSSVLTNLRQAQVDAVLLAVLPSQAGNIIRQMSQSGSFKDVKLAGTLAASPEIHSIAGQASVGMVFPQVWAPGGSGSADFEKAYQKKYGAAPEAYGALGYEVGWIVAAAIGKVAQGGQEVTATAIRDAIPGASTSDTVKQHGILDLALAPDGSAMSQGVLATFDKDGRIVAVAGG